MEQSRKHGAFDPRYVSRPSPEAPLQRRSVAVVRERATDQAVVAPAPTGGVS